MVNTELWKPGKSELEGSNLAEFQRYLKDEYEVEFSSYNDLHQWSVDNSEKFWLSVLKFFNICYEGEIEPISQGTGFLEYPWFPNVKLNFAENLLRGESNEPALSFFHESDKEESYTFQELRIITAKLQTYLRKSGFKKGDVLACYMPNIPETVISMLACSSLGGVFTSTSADFGIQGVVDRFSQSKPKILVMAAGYYYNGKYFDLTGRVNELRDKIPSLEKIILVDFFRELSGPIKGYDLWEKEIEKESFGELSFERLSFSDPLYIMYSSGTTGKPKCIVHGTGGTLLQHFKELSLHTNVKNREKIFYFTTCGWMMWNWLVSAMGVGGEVVLYDGSPGFPSLDAFMQKIEGLGINTWGTSPKFLRALETNDWAGGRPFKDLKAILSTGAPLLPEQFDYIQGKIKNDIQISSICGGTDIVSCFMLGCPTKPVIRGEIQCLGLGMDVACFNSQGQEVFDEEGELVCKRPFISQPIYFLDDEKKEKIKKAYFSTFEGVWHHGDFVTITSDKSVKVFGRSDATLNPGGVRIGTGEIYRQTEKIDFIEDTLCVGKKQSDGDVEIVLFVKLRDPEEGLTEERILEIKKIIKSNTTPRHVPREIYQVSDIPYTRSGKKVELAITRVINGRDINNKEAIANPECLEEYKRFV